MSRWSDPTDDLWDEPYCGAPSLEDITVTVTDNPVVAELLGPDGDVIRQWRERPPFGFR